MALNVNIIGKDSEGNLQALKVNSEGNLEISDSLGWGELLQDIFDKLDILTDKLSGTVVTLYGERTPTIEPGQELELIRLEIPNNVGRLKLAVTGASANVQAMEVIIRTALADANLDFPSACFWQTVEKPYDSENWKQIGGAARSKIIDTFGDWIRVSIKNTSTTTPYDVRFYVGGAQ